MTRSLTPYRERTRMSRPEFILFGPLQRQIERLFEDFAVPAAGGSANNLIPRIEVSENEKEIRITAEMPGLERGDVEITLEGNMLTLRGENQREREKDDKNQNVHVSERSYGVFVRTIELPQGIDPESVQATMSNGVLTITVPKPERTQSKKIDVRDGSSSQANGGQQAAH